MLDNGERHLVVITVDIEDDGLIVHIAQMRMASWCDHPWYPE